MWQQQDDQIAIDIMIFIWFYYDNSEPDTGLVVKVAVLPARKDSREGLANSAENGIITSTLSLVVVFGFRFQDYLRSSANCLIGQNDYVWRLGGCTSRFAWNFIDSIEFELRGGGRCYLLGKFSPFWAARFDR